ncbi:MAG: hypothetical protein QG656_392, partial [Candidatus Hydrogenedentes bacterium]|nr:hypothetical protein [Candidatus Hydrogenedentota bacterium]
MKNCMTRRGFLQRAAAGVAGPLVLPRLSLGASADGRLRHAAIGVANMGKGDLFAIAGSGRVDIVALCDIDENHLNAAAQPLPNARLYRDWRELLDKEKDNIDSVNVSTPDHMHAPIALSAIELGKHVYCQKPLAHEVFEARRLTEAARNAGVVTQMGIQIHSYDVYRRAVMMLRSGVIGKVKEWHSWCSASYSTPGMDRPAGEDPVPPTVNWDSWIGVAPMRPYKEGVYHPRSWRTWRDFGCGSMGDFGCHIFDPVFTALKLGAPRTVRAEAPEFTAEVWPQWSIVHYEFPGTHWTAGDTIQGTWYDGGKQPPHELAPPLAEGQKWPDMGSLILGEEGAMLLPHIDE